VGFTIVHPSLFSNRTLLQRRKTECMQKLMSLRLLFLSLHEMCWTQGFSKPFEAYTSNVEGTRFLNEEMGIRENGIREGEMGGCETGEREAVHRPLIGGVMGFYSKILQVL
jgi:hypothetical protein